MSYRNNSRLVLVLMFLFLVVPLQTNGQEYLKPGNELLHNMHEHEKAMDEKLDTDFAAAGKYSGFVMGIFDLLDWQGVICHKERVSQQQAWAVVTKYLKAYPAERNEPAVFLVTKALTKAFPCGRK